LCWPQLAVCTLAEYFKEIFKLFLKESWSLAEKMPTGLKNNFNFLFIQKFYLLSNLFLTSFYGAVTFDQPRPYPQRFIFFVTYQC